MDDNRWEAEAGPLGYEIEQARNAIIRWSRSLRPDGDEAEVRRLHAIAIADMERVASLVDDWIRLPHPAPGRRKRGRKWMTLGPLYESFVIGLALFYAGTLVYTFTGDESVRALALDAIKSVDAWYEAMTPGLVQAVGGRVADFATVDFWAKEAKERVARFEAAGECIASEVQRIRTELEM